MMMEDRERRGEDAVVGERQRVHKEREIQPLQDEPPHGAAKDMEIGLQRGAGSYAAEPVQSNTPTLHDPG